MADIPSQMVSVIMPAFNAEKTIERAVRSLLGQTLQDFELIIVDDGSSDGTESVCRGMASDKIVFLQQENAGPAAARNLGLKKARGDLICFVDSDDVVDKDYLRLLSRTIRGADLAICGYRTRKEGAEDLPDSGDRKNAAHPDEEPVTGEASEVMKLVLTDESIGGFLWNKIFRKSLIDQGKLSFNRKLFVGEDLLFVEQYLTLCGKVKRIDRPLYGYYDLGTSISHAVSRKNLTLLRALETISRLSDDPELKEIIAVRYTRQFLALYPYFFRDKRLRAEFAGFKEKSGFTDRQILGRLTGDYKLRWHLYRVNPAFYALCMAARRQLRR